MRGSGGEKILGAGVVLLLAVLVAWLFLRSDGAAETDPKALFVRAMDKLEKAGNLSWQIESRYEVQGDGGEWALRRCTLRLEGGKARMETVDRTEGRPNELTARTVSDGHRYVAIEAWDGQETGRNQGSVSAEFSTLGRRTLLLFPHPDPRMLASLLEFDPKKMPVLTAVGLYDLQYLGRGPGRKEAHFRYVLRSPGSPERVAVDLWIDEETRLPVRRAHRKTPESSPIVETFVSVRLDGPRDPGLFALPEDAAPK